MSSFTPPNPYFNGIDFNDKFYSQTSGSYITLTYANNHYLYSYSGANAISKAITTNFNGSVGIGTTPSTFQLDIYNPSSTVNVCRIQSGSANGSLVLSGGIGGSLGYINFVNTAGTLCGL